MHRVQRLRFPEAVSSFALRPEGQVAEALDEHTEAGYERKVEKQSHPLPAGCLNDRVETRGNGPTTLGYVSSRIAMELAEGLRKVVFQFMRAKKWTKTDACTCFRWSRGQ